MKLSDDQMIEALKEAGHQEAATALEQKRNAAAAAESAAAGGGGQGKPEPARPAAKDGVHGPRRMARAYGDAAGGKGEGS